MFDRPHYQLSIGGTCVTNAEIWQTSVRFAPTEGSDVDDLKFALTNISVSDIFADFAAVITNTDSTLSYPAHTALRFAKLAIIDTSGHYAAEPKVHEGLAKGAATAQSGATPPQLAWCVTLGTGRSFGQAQRGRMYWPVPFYIVNAADGVTGQLPIGNANGFRDKVKTALVAAEGEVSTVSTGAFAAVMSQQGTGTTNAITEISVGNVLDTQRRRRNNLVEVYTPTPALRGEREQLAAPPARRTQ